MGRGPYCGAVEETPAASPPDGPGGSAQPPLSGKAAEPADAPAEVAEAPIAPAERRPSWIGVWAFVCAILGLGLLPVIGSVLGIVLGRVAIRRSTERPVRGGRGLAVAAFVIGLVTLTVVVVLCAAYSLVVAFGPS